MYERQLYNEDDEDRNPFEYSMKIHKGNSLDMFNGAKNARRDKDRINSITKP